MKFLHGRESSQCQVQAPAIAEKVSKHLRLGYVIGPNSALISSAASSVLSSALPVSASSDVPFLWVRSNDEEHEIVGVSIKCSTAVSDQTGALRSCQSWHQ